jgi:hypothetical protein
MLLSDCGGHLTSEHSGIPDINVCPGSPDKLNIIVKDLLTLNLRR